MQLPKEFEERMKNIIPNYDKFLEENEKENIKGPFIGRKGDNGHYVKKDQQEKCRKRVNL